MPAATAGCCRVDVLEVLHHLVFVRADDHLAVGVDQEGVTDAAEVDRVDDLDQGVEGHVTADHADQFAVALALHRGGDGDHQATDRPWYGAVSTVCPALAAAPYQGRWRGS
jgi:hypothetical protein